MTSTLSTLWSPPWLASCALAVCLLPGCAVTASPDPRREMIATLGAAAPHPSMGGESAIFDRLVGTWDSRFSFRAADGTVSYSRGEVRFGWIIDGRALQDIWIGYPRDSTRERSIGTSVRFFDTATRIWRVVFIAPAFGLLLELTGGAQGDRIVLRGTDRAGLSLRWSFNDIQADSFVWRGETSSDGGRTWHLAEEHQMRRRKGRDARDRLPLDARPLREIPR